MGGQVSFEHLLHSTASRSRIRSLLVRGRWDHQAQVAEAELGCCPHPEANSGGQVYVVGHAARAVDSSGSTGFTYVDA